jgi:arylsulfatase
MTGKHGGHAWVRNNTEVKPEGQTPLPKSEVTVAELLKKQGYTTAAIGKWGLGPPGTEGDPLAHGFDHFFGYNCQRHAHNHYPTYLWRDDRKEKLEGNDGTATGKQHTHDLFEREALAFLRTSKDKPFFLYLPVTIPHVAIQVPDDSLAEYKGKWDDPAYDGKKGYQPHPAPRAGYAAMVTRMDRTVGRVLDLLKELKMEENTLVLFSSDNGPTHGGVGGSDSAFFESAGVFRGLKGDVYEGGIRVPLIARWPGKIKPGTIDHICYFPDMLPTLLDVAGAANATPKNVDGISFLPTLLGQKEKQTPHEYLFWEFHGYGGQQALRMGDWKAVRRDINKGNTKIELYNLKDDVSEKTNVADKHADVVAKMEKRMREAHSPSKQYPLKGE